MFRIGRTLVLIGLAFCAGMGVQATMTPAAAASVRPPLASCVTVTPFKTTPAPWSTARATATHAIFPFASVTPTPVLSK